jgi:hypothetical protein
VAFVGLWYHLRGLAQQRVLLATLILWGLDVSICLWSSSSNCSCVSTENCTSLQYCLAELWQAAYFCYRGTIAWRCCACRGCRVASLDIQGRTVYVPLYPVARIMDLASVLCGMDILRSDDFQRKARFKRLVQCLAGWTSADYHVIPNQAARRIYQQAFEKGSQLGGREVRRNCVGRRAIRYAF